MDKVLYDNHSTVSNRYYDSKSSIKSSHVEVIRPTVNVHSLNDYNRINIEVCETVIQNGCEIERV